MVQNGARVGRYVTRFLPVALVGASLLFAGGCSTTSSETSSASPWNAPQRWEQQEIHHDGSPESTAIMVGGYGFFLGEFIAAILRR